MTKSVITKEMKPKGVVRETIVELANQKGAYIIVSSSTNATKTQLTNLIDAMKKVAQEIPNGIELYFDFYDQN